MASCLDLILFYVITKLINKIYDHGYWMAYTSSYNVDEMKVGNSKQIS